MFCSLFINIALKEAVFIYSVHRDESYSFSLWCNGTQGSGGI